MQITGSTIYVQYRPQYNGEEKKDPILTGYKLGNRLAYSAAVTSDGELTVTVNGEVRKYQFDVASYRSDRWYAKAGMYSQQEIGGAGAGKATFHSLSMTHSDRTEASEVVQQAESQERHRQNPGALVPVRGSAGRASGELQL